MAAGCFIYCLREGFEQIGGFSEGVYASEEIWFSRRLRKWGARRGLEFRVITEPRIISSARKLDRPFRVALMFLLILVFPFAVRFKNWCSFWYPQDRTSCDGRPR
jgi:hypothetical protein